MHPHMRGPISLLRMQSSNSTVMSMQIGVCVRTTSRRTLAALWTHPNAIRLALAIAPSSVEDTIQIVLLGAHMEAPTLQMSTI